jgi:hypothetical protein
MALDVYVWLAQRLHRVSPGRPQLITWLALYEQFGQGFARVRDFRRRFLQTLHHVQSAYPHARLIASEVGLTLEHSPPPVPPRYTSVLAKASSHDSIPSHGKLVAPPVAPQPTEAAMTDDAGRGDDTPDNPLNSCMTEAVS